MSSVYFTPKLLYNFSHEQNSKGQVRKHNSLPVRVVGRFFAWQKKLAKLLYYVDFDRYEYKESEKSITGDIYKVWKMGPVPQSFSGVVDSMQHDGLLAVDEQEDSSDYLPTSVYSTKRKADLSVFDAEDLQILQHVVNKYGKLTSKQLEDLTHAEAPYIGTEPNDEIVYELAFYRGTDFSDVIAAA
jgi:uncharacterized phage-associated protein